jgi:dTDP-4-dehydrorhamnose reductase
VTNETGSIVVVGRNGQVARSLWDVLRAGNRNVVQIGRPDVDLLDPRSTTDAILALKPSIVINAAAYTAVDKAEDEPKIAEAINSTGAEIIARAAALAGAPVVHFSTDYIFDGTKRSPYLESDSPMPLGVYGRTKLAGEQRVATANPRHVILRTAWVFSPFGNNFVKTILRLSKDRPELRIVGDQYGNPTYAGDLAQAVAALAPKITGASPDSDCFGVFHAVNRGATTWFQFTRTIVEAAVLRGAGNVPVLPIATEDYPTRAQRPAYSILSTDKLRAIYGIQLPPWEQALSHCLDELIAPLDDQMSERQRIAGVSH